MLVSQEFFTEVIKDLSSAQILFVDTETTGLSVWKEDKLFSIIIASENSPAYYFNFNPEEPLQLLNEEHLREIAGKLFTKEKMCVFHNAKFDMHMLAKAGAPVLGEVYCTEVNARIVYNEHLSYTLDSCLSRIGLEKLDTPKKWCLENKQWRWEKQAGKKKREKVYFYNKVPLDIIVPYGVQDVVGLRSLYNYQQNELKKLDDKKILNISKLESTFTRTLYTIENTGILIDKAYCNEAFDYEYNEYKKAEIEFKELTGIDFVDSEKVFEQVFQDIKDQFVYTEKGNTSFKDDVINNFNHPVVPVIQKYREHYKKAHTYYQNLSYLSDENSVIHCGFKQAGARTGRLSCEKPNLQNIPKREEDTSVYKIRKAFIPRPGFFFVEMDYKAMEFRLMLDYAQESELIEKVKNGHDPHQATADLCNISRSAAKTLNFGLLYGMGVGKLSKQLNVSIEEARVFKRKYFNALPNVQAFLEKAMYAAKNRHYVFNWYGRRYQFPNPEFGYKAANSIIQGGCADVVRIAMNGCISALTPLKSKLILQVHDSLLFEVANDEAHIVPQMQEIMENAYRYISLPLAVDAKYSTKSWEELVDWGDNVEKA